jgi:hypothetical protein
MVDQAQIDILQVRGEISDNLVGNFVTLVAGADDADAIESHLEEFVDQVKAKLN